MLQALVVVQRKAVLPLHRRLNAALRLLDHVPRLMRQVFFLSRPDVDVAALRVSQRVKLRRLG